MELGVSSMAPRRNAKKTEWALPIRIPTKSASRQHAASWLELAAKCAPSRRDRDGSRDGCVVIANLGLLRRMIPTAGAILVAVSLYFVGHQLWQHRAQMGAWRPAGDDLAWLAACCVAYAGACLVLSTNWRALLEGFGDVPPVGMVCHSIYAKSQLAKYLPGNVLQIAGRHIMGREIGLSHGALVLATAYEILGLVVSSGALAIAGFMLAGMAGQPAVALSAGLLILGGVGFGLSGDHLVRWLSRRYASESAIHTAARRRLLIILAGYLLFFIVTGAVLLVLVANVIGASMPELDLTRSGIILMSVATGWIAGYITPGAPAGIGVREAVIALSLTPLLQRPDALLAALLFRATTVVGDVLFFTLVSAAGLRERRL